MNNIDYKVEVFTGVRPTSGLTIANAIGAVNPILELQKKKEISRPMVFVADLHGLTDGEPEDTQKNVLEVVKDYISLGLDVNDSDIFIQSHLVSEISELNLYLSRLISVAELMRVPTLKEKLKAGQNEFNANTLLAFYPIMMASDILLQSSKYVPVGDDQVVHLEVTADLAKRFNKKYGEVFVIPRVLSLGEPIRIKSLNGNGKMSKSDPSGAVILDDDINISLNKVKKAQTAFAGEMSDTLESLIHIGKFVSDDEGKKEIDDILQKHMNGENVMGEFKSLLCISLEKYLKSFQEKKRNISDSDVLKIVQKGGIVAKENAQECISRVRESMGLRYL